MTGKHHLLLKCIDVEMCILDMYSPLLSNLEKNSVLTAIRSPNCLVNFVPMGCRLNIVLLHLQYPPSCTSKQNRKARVWDTKASSPKVKTRYNGA